MPKRRLSCALAVLLVPLATAETRACPVDGPYLLCEGLRQALVAGDTDAALERAAELRRALAKRPSADRFEELTFLLEVLGWQDDTLAAERKAVIEAWAERFPDDPRATLAKIGPFDFGGGDVAALDRLAARFPESVAVAEARVDHLEDVGSEREARALVEALVARRPDDLEALHLLFEVEWNERRTGRALELGRRWRENAPDDPSALLHTLVVEAERLTADELDLRIEELFAATDEVRWRLALCERLPWHREERCIEKLLADWSFARATAAERELLVPYLAATGRWTELRVILAAEPDAERAAELRRTIRSFAAAVDESEVACDLPSDLTGPIPDHERDVWLVDCGSVEEKLARAEELLDGGGGDDPEHESRWILQALATESAVRAAIRARAEREPTRGELWRILADAASRFDGGDERGLVEAWWRAAPDDLDALARMATLERAAGEPRFALALLTERFERSPSCGRADRAEELIDFHLESDDFDSVHAFASELAPFGGELEETGRLGRARALLAAGDSERALAELRSAPFLERAKNATELELRILVARGEFDEVEARLRHADDGRAPSVLHLAERALELGANELARRTFAAAVRDDARSPEAWSGLGRALVARDEWLPAERALRRALALRFDDHEAFGALAALLSARGRHADVAALLAPDDRLTPASPSDLAAAARAALAAGDRSSAERIARQLELADPGSDEFRALASELTTVAAR